LCLFVVTTGCAEKKVPASGMITLDGKPLANAIVSFIPEGNRGQPAGATAGSDGQFTVPGGMVPGEYKAIVAVNAMGDVGRAPDPANEVAVREYRAKLAKIQATFRNPIPAAYGSPEQTPLRFSVPTDGPIRLDLTGSKSRD
jgi:hypothetical protein